MPRISIVVPTFNAPALLAATLAAIFAQTFGDFELIVVDDGSTDATAEYLSTLTDPRLRVIRQDNGGVGAARNRGIDESRADLIAFCDHDDLWLPQKLATQVALLDAHPDYVACAVPWAESTAPERPVYVHAGPTPRVERPLETLAHGGLFLITSAIMARRSALTGLRYFTRPRCIEDTPLQLRLLARGPFGIAGDAIGMIYRRHAGNYSASADYFLNGVGLLRELQAGGYFAEVGDQTGLEEFLCHLARTAAAAGAKSGRRAAALQLYRREFARQARDGAWKFLLGLPVLAALPRRAKH